MGIGYRSAYQILIGWLSDQVTCLPTSPLCFPQIPNCQVAVSVYCFLESFTQLERKLSDLQGGAALPRSQHSLHDLRSKMDKFVRAMGSSSIQVSAVA